MLGYYTQAGYAAYLFLTAPTNSDFDLGIEVYDDCSTEDSTSIFSIQTKSTISANNPASNKSADLWKTLSNWSKALKDGVYQGKKASFCYVVISDRNLQVGSVCEKLKEINDDQAATDALNDFGTLLIEENIQESPKHPSADSFIKECLSEEMKEHFKKVMISFDYKTMPRESLSKAHLTELTRLRTSAFQEHSEAILEQFIGKITLDAEDQLAKTKCFRISYSDLSKWFTLCVEAHRQDKTIPDFTDPNQISAGQKSSIVNGGPIFVQQLREIDISEEDILARVEWYLRAGTQKRNMINKLAFLHESFEEYQRKLVLTWENIYSQVEIEKRDLEQKERGKLILLKTEFEVASDKIHLNGMEPPYYFGKGTLEHMADSQKVWWDPCFAKTQEKNDD